MCGLSERIGVSTCWMPSRGESLFEAIEATKRAGFKSFELVPQLAPRFCRPSQVSSVGFYTDDADERFLGELKQAVTEFRVVTVHSHNVDINLASTNPGIQKESARQFLELIELAHRIGANPVTFHHGQSLPNVRINRHEFERLVEINVAFAKHALEIARPYGIQLGYENLGGSTAPVEEELLWSILNRVADERFGLNLDIGHLPLVGGDPKEWINRFSGLIKEVHLHGTYYRGDRQPPLINHSPLEMEDYYNFCEILEELNKVGFQGPMIFEIHAPSLGKYLDFARRGREFLLTACLKED